jgi:hypothetical protein
MTQQDQNPVTHFVVPIGIFQAVVKTLETLPYGQVSAIMQGLQSSVPYAAPPQPQQDAPSPVDDAPPSPPPLGSHRKGNGKRRGKAKA